MPIIKTASWFSPLPEGHIRVGISRGIPRRTPAGYRVYRKLAPGPWFLSVSAQEYDHRYRTEILGPLDPRVVASELSDLAGGRIPCLLCYERVPYGPWCHRALAAAWLAEGLGQPVPELGFEDLPQAQHPYMSAELRR